MTVARDLDAHQDNALSLPPWFFSTVSSREGYLRKGARSHIVAVNEVQPGGKESYGLTRMSQSQRDVLGCAHETS